jgi:hypothetical protein
MKIQIASGVVPHSSGVVLAFVCASPSVEGVCASAEIFSTDAEAMAWVDSERMAFEESLGELEAIKSQFGR